jgi:hypothetical protein
LLPRPESQNRCPARPPFRRRHMDEANRYDTGFGGKPAATEGWVAVGIAYH